MKVIAALGLLALLGACGADGEPIRPSLNTNISIGSGGISTSTGVSVRSGPVTVGVQL